MNIAPPPIIDLPAPLVNGVKIHLICIPIGSKTRYCEAENVVLLRLKYDQRFFRCSGTLNA